MSDAPEPRRHGRRASYVFNRDAALMARLRKGWTERDVIAECKRLGLPRVGNLHKYERGLLTPAPQTLHALATVYGVPVEDLASPRTEGSAA
jgi:transcriptional regulator with XRE-family HTH domain